MATFTGFGWAPIRKCQCASLMALLLLLVVLVVSAYKCVQGSVITEPKDVKALYTNASDHAKAHAANMGFLLSQVMGHGAGLINGQRWVNLRHEIDHFFDRKQALTMTHDFNQHADLYVRTMAQYALPDRTDEEKKPGRFVVNAAQALTRYPYYEIAKMFCKWSCILGQHGDLADTK